MREKIVELLEKTFEKQYEKNLVITAYSTANYLVAHDVVQVVRCKDCRFAVTPYGDEVDGFIECTNIHGRPLFREDGFCSYGERGKDGDL